MPTLKAKIMGFYGKRRIRPGVTFEFPADKKIPKWATVIEATPATSVQGGVGADPLSKKPAPAKSIRQMKVDADLAD